MSFTDVQKELLLCLGGPVEDDRPISVEVLDELVQLGLLYKRDDGAWDLTDEGEAEYDRLSGRKDGW